jgi:hypothetical protein
MTSLLTTRHTTVLLNGFLGPWIACRHDIRQEDPLSPYLFIIVTDLLHRMITNVIAPTVHLHLLMDDLKCPMIQYMDNTLVLLRAEESQVRCLKDVLNAFVAATDPAVNFSKSTFIPINVDDGHAYSLVAILSCTVRGSPRHTWASLPLIPRSWHAFSIASLSRSSTTSLAVASTP